jgi:hypothetical protein
MFKGNTFVGADVCAYNRTAMLSGASATQICFQQGSSVGGLLPSDLDGTTPPPTGSPNYVVNFGTNRLNLYKMHVDFATPSNSSFTGPTAITVAAFTPLINGGTCVVQPSTTQRLDSLADRMMYRLAYRHLGTHESLVANHSVAITGGGGVRWYEIQNPSGTPILAQQGTFAPDSSYRWMGSIAMDQAGDMAVGYSVASSSIRPSVRYTGRVPSDPAGTMEAEVNVVTGGGSQTGGLSRWGDYSAMTVDPVDDCTFWFTTEYMKTTGSFNWATRIANFKFPTLRWHGIAGLHNRRCSIHDEYRPRWKWHQHDYDNESEWLQRCNHAQRFGLARRRYGGFLNQSSHSSGQWHGEFNTYIDGVRNGHNRNHQHYDHRNFGITHSQHNHCVDRDFLERRRASDRRFRFHAEGSQVRDGRNVVRFWCKFVVGSGHDERRK